MSAWWRGTAAQVPRAVVANDRATGSAHPPNVVTNTKFTPLTFVPLALAQQFRQVMNIYFLLIACLQLVPSITPVSPLTTWVPLGVIFAITAVKEGIDDLGRRRADNAANARRYAVARADGLCDVASREIRVGDVLRLATDEEVPCDCVLLSTSDARGVAYVQTTNLDGESNLKARTSPAETRGVRTPAAAARFVGVVECGPPDEHIYRFDARLVLPGGGAVVPLSAAQLLPQATTLRNVEWAYAVAVYTGNETKFGKNKRPPPTKYTATDEFIGSVSAAIFVFQLALVVTFGAVGDDWSRTVGDGSWYLGPPGTGDLPGGGPRAAAALVIPARFLLLNSTMIPISLKLTLDLVKLGYARFVEADPWLARPATAPTADGTGGGPPLPARSNSTALGEDFGQVQAVLTDKTGTLTENVMVLRTVSVRGVVYDASGRAPPDGGAGAASPPPPASVPEYEAAARAAGIPIDDRLAGAVRRESAAVFASGAAGGSGPSHAALDFFRCLALCNDVLPEALAAPAPAPTPARQSPATPSTAPRRYKASSPDEEALVKAAAGYGVALWERDGDAVSLALDGWGFEAYESLAVADFTSDRKRMSVVVRAAATGAVRVFTKGADDVMMARLAGGAGGAETAVAAAVQAQLDALAAAGLRTLVLATRELSAAEYAAFTAEYGAACASMGDRDAAKEAVASRLLETGLTLLGATAIEDKLQAGVPRTVGLLRDAGVALWMLTGDKASTALTIAGTAALKSPDAALYEVAGDSAGGVAASLRSVARALSAAGRPVRVAPVGAPRSWPRAAAARARRAFGCGHADDGVQPPRGRFAEYGATGVVVPGAAVYVGPRDATVSLSGPARSTVVGGGGGGLAATLTVGGGGGGGPLRYCVLIRGAALDAALSPDLRALFAGVCLGAETVICCRVTPKQKAAVVRLVKEAGVRTLAIGDGGNDVAMIQEAHVGVGVAGKEGLQAARASDVQVYAFRSLGRLLLVHGRYSYARTALVAQYSFYKSFAFCMLQIGFGFASGFAGVSLFNSLCVAAYNAVLFVPIVLFLTDRDVTQDTALTTPAAYRMCNSGALMTRRTMAWWLLRGLWHAAALLIIALYGCAAGRSGDYESMGLLVFFGYLWTQDLTMLLALRRVTALNVATVFGMHAVAFVVAMAMNATPRALSFIDYWSFFNTLGDPAFWLAHALMTAVTVLPPYAATLYTAAFGDDVALRLYRYDAATEAEIAAGVRRDRGQSALGEDDGDDDAVARGGRRRGGGGGGGGGSGGGSGGGGGSGSAGGKSAVLGDARIDVAFGAPVRQRSAGTERLVRVSDGDAAGAVDAPLLEALRARSDGDDGPAAATAPRPASFAAAAAAGRMGASSAALAVAPVHPSGGGGARSGGDRRDAAARGAAAAVAAAAAAVVPAAQVAQAGGSDRRPVSVGNPLLSAPSLSGGSLASRPSSAGSGSGDTARGLLAAAVRAPPASTGMASPLSV